MMNSYNEYLNSLRVENNVNNPVPVTPEVAPVTPEVPVMEGQVPTPVVEQPVVQNLDPVMETPTIPEAVTTQEAVTGPVVEPVLEPVVTEQVVEQTPEVAPEPVVDTNIINSDPIVNTSTEPVTVATEEATVEPVAPVTFNKNQQDLNDVFDFVVQTINTARVNTNEFFTKENAKNQALEEENKVLKEKLEVYQTELTNASTQAVTPTSPTPVVAENIQAPGQVVAPVVGPEGTPDNIVPEGTGPASGGPTLTLTPNNGVGAEVAQDVTGTTPPPLIDIQLPENTAPQQGQIAA